MESTWKEVTNGSLRYSWQRSDIEMLLSLWDTLDDGDQADAIVDPI
jgi:hypothetical protein